MTIYSKMTILAGLALYPTILLGTWLGPLKRAPSMLFVFPLFLGPLGLVIYLSLLLIGPIMWIWNKEAFDGATTIPKRSIVLLVITLIISVLLGATVLPDARQFLGDTRAAVIYSISFVCQLTLAGLYLLNKRNARFSQNLVFHWLLFSWLLTYAFPVVLTDVP
jgi:hypothetical protein